MTSGPTSFLGSQFSYFASPQIGSVQHLFVLN